MKMLAIALLIFGLLIFGCTSPSGGANNAPVPAQNGTTAQGSASPPVNNTVSAPSQGNASGQQVSQGNNSAAPSGSNLLGMTFTQLVALGVPLQCDITSTMNGQSVKSTIYMQGKDTIRSETSITQKDSPCTNMVTIVKSGTAYIGCNSGALFPSSDTANPLAGCQWIVMNTNSSTTSGSPLSAPDYSNVPPAQINCVPWVYDPSKFDITGKTCNLQDIMGGIQNPNG